MNEMYARDVSKKTKAAKKAKAGQFMGSKPPFGYKLDPNDRHHLMIGEPAAEVVRRIFRPLISIVSLCVTAASRNDNVRVLCMSRPFVDAPCDERKP